MAVAGGQTSLLALNAAIESTPGAIRAGVLPLRADEVRGLAVRTQDSREQIDPIISDINRATRDATSQMASQTRLLTEVFGCMTTVIEVVNHTVDEANPASALIDPTSHNADPSQLKQA